MDKVKKGAMKKPTVNNSGLPFKIGRFLKKYRYAAGPKRKPASRSVKGGPQYPPPPFLLGIAPSYVPPVGYIPPACQRAIYKCRILQVHQSVKVILFDATSKKPFWADPGKKASYASLLLEYAKNPARYNMKALGKES